MIVNSGNANAATGEQGIADALRMRGEAAEASALEPETVAVAETGVIGVPLDIEIGLGRDRRALRRRSPTTARAPFPTRSAPPTAGPSTARCGWTA